MGAHAKDECFHRFKVVGHDDTGKHARADVQPASGTIDRQELQCRGPHSLSLGVDPSTLRAV